MSKPGKIINQTSGDHQLYTTMMLKVLSRLSPSMSFTPDWLHANIREKHPQEMKIGLYNLTYLGQPGGRGKEHLWRIYTNNFAEKKRLDEAVKSKSPGLIPVETSEQNNNSDNPFDWNGLKLRSIAEQKIAEELEKRQILFFANARCRISNRQRITQTKETDFLVIYKKTVRILEVDGREYHQTAAVDHQRDRLFERYGLRCTRFTANECLDDPKNVIDEFLELFEGEISTFNWDDYQKTPETIDVNVDDCPF